VEEIGFLDMWTSGLVPGRDEPGASKSSRTWCKEKKTSISHLTDLIPKLSSNTASYEEICATSTAKLYGEKRTLLLERIFHFLS
jgi:hypothetical protein